MAEGIKSTTRVNQSAEKGNQCDPVTIKESGISGIKGIISNCLHMAIDYIRIFFYCNGLVLKNGLQLGRIRGRLCE